jgi:hypothetical protein
VNTQSQDDPFVQRLADQLDQLAAQVSPPDEAPTPAESHDRVSAVVAQLRVAATWTEPPADLRATVLARVLAGPATSSESAVTDAELVTEPRPKARPSDPEAEPAADLTAPDAEVTTPDSEVTTPDPDAATRDADLVTTDPEAGTDARPAAGGPRLSVVDGGPAAALPTVPATVPPTETEAEDRPVDLAARRRLRRRWAAVPIAAVAAVSFTFSVLAIERVLQDDPPRGTTYAASGTSLAPEAEATVSVASAAAGFSIVIDAKDLPAAAPGSYYVAWLKGPRGTVPIGSLHARKIGRPVTMWSGVDPAAYPTFTLTLQREGQPVTTPSRLVVLNAQLSGS